jgi:hypothetical protein
MQEATSPDTAPGAHLAAPPSIGWIDFEDAEAGEIWTLDTSEPQTRRTFPQRGTIQLAAPRRSRLARIDSGSSSRKGVEVQVLSSAPKQTKEFKPLSRVAFLLPE